MRVTMSSASWRHARTPCPPDRNGGPHEVRTWLTLAFSYQGVMPWRHRAAAASDERATVSPPPAETSTVVPVADRSTGPVLPSGLQPVTAGALCHAGRTAYHAMPSPLSPVPD